ncbi:MAG: RNA-guided endonuclease TnpB family protein [Ktedonobacteraceae bacterium]
MVSPKRHLKKLSGQEARFKKNTNHIISKRIVQKAKANGQALATEDPGHIRNRTEGMVRRSQRAKHSSWPFGQLRLFLSHKAALAGVPLHTVEPRNTSRTCSRCKHCAKENCKSQASFCCVNCGHTDNADRNAAINISRADVMRPIASGRVQVQAAGL